MNRKLAIIYFFFFAFICFYLIHHTILYSCLFIIYSRLFVNKIIYLLFLLNKNIIREYIQKNY